MQFTSTDYISNKINLPINKVNSTLKLLGEGATVPFIARYRKEATGSLDETVIHQIKILNEQFTGYLILNNIKNKIYQLLSAHNYKKIFVGFSGGADSTCLLFVLKQVCFELNIQLTAVHFEHGLRGELSIADAEWCREFCKKETIDFVEIKLNIKSTSNTEAVARDLRYQNLKKLIIDKEKEVVALGHHNGDKVENFFLRSVRGGNTTALTSMRKENELYGIKIIRPLLDLSKNKIEQYLITNEIADWREDHTNQESEYNRNFFRNEIIKKIYDKIPGSNIGIQHSLNAVQADAEFIESFANEKFLKVKDEKHIKLNFVNEMHDAVLIRFLRYWLSYKMGFEFIPDRNFIERFKEEIKSLRKAYKLIPVKDCFQLYLSENEIFVHKVKAKLDKTEWNWKFEPTMIYGDYILEATAFKYNDSDKSIIAGACFDEKFIPDTFIVRSWEDGDRMIPFAKTKPVKLKKLFNDRKIPALIKQNIPLICMPDDTIIWIPGVKRSSFAAANDSTERILKITFKKN